MLLDRPYKYCTLRFEREHLAFHAGNIGRPPYTVSMFSLWLKWSRPGYRWYWSFIEYDGRPTWCVGCGLFTVGVDGYPGMLTSILDTAILWGFGVFNQLFGTVIMPVLTRRRNDGE